MLKNFSRLTNMMGFNPMNYVILDTIDNCEVSNPFCSSVAAMRTVKVLNDHSLNWHGQGGRYVLRASAPRCAGRREHVSASEPHWLETNASGLNRYGR